MFPSRFLLKWGSTRQKTALFWSHPRLSLVWLPAAVTNRPSVTESVRSRSRYLRSSNFLTKPNNSKASSWLNMRALVRISYRPRRERISSPILMAIFCPRRINLHSIRMPPVKKLTCLNRTANTPATLGALPKKKCKFLIIRNLLWVSMKQGLLIRGKPLTTKNLDSKRPSWRWRANWARVLRTDWKVGSATQIMCSWAISSQLLHRNDFSRRSKALTCKKKKYVSSRTKYNKTSRLKQTHCSQARSKR